MKERPILFNAEMVRAIIDGRKTQTRRPVKPRIVPIIDECFRVNGKWCPHTFDYDLINLSPYGCVGGQLWVRETFCNCIDSSGADDFEFTAYRATQRLPHKALKWTPSIHMPRWASRLLLDVVSVRVERVQDISEEDAKAEGAYPEFEVDIATFVHGKTLPESTHALGFKHLWQKAYPGSWERNEWVWVIEFRKAQRNGGEA